MPSALREKWEAGRAKRESMNTKLLVLRESYRICLAARRESSIRERDISIRLERTQQKMLETLQTESEAKKRQLSDARDRTGQSTNPKERAQLKKIQADLTERLCEIELKRENAMAELKQLQTRTHERTIAGVEREKTTLQRKAQFVRAKKVRQKTRIEEIKKRYRRLRTVTKSYDPDVDRLKRKAKELERHIEVEEVRIKEATRENQDKLRSIESDFEAEKSRRLRERQQASVRFLADLQGDVGRSYADCEFFIEDSGRRKSLLAHMVWA